MYEWDEPKAEANLAKHGVSFDAVEGFDWETAVVTEDRRQDYGETRFAAIGLIEGVIYTPRKSKVRVISLRIASREERRTFRAAQA